MSAIPADFAPSPPRWWPAGLGLAALLLLLFAGYWDTYATMVGVWWRSETFAHAFLVPPISLWLIWRLRHRLAVLEPRPQLVFLLPFAAAAGLWFAGDLVAANVLTQLAGVLAVIFAVPLMLGAQVGAALAFPLAFLLFCVPIGEFMMPALMEGTANVIIWALQMSGIPVYREGLQFVIPSGQWSVVEACSGLRYLIASVMVGSLFAYLNYRSLRRRLIFVGVSILMPLVANWVRAYGIVMLGHLSDNKIATGVDHLVYGWVFFGVVISLMFMVGARWSEDPADLSAAAAAEDVRLHPPTRLSPGPATVALALAVALAVAFAPRAALWQLDHQLSAAAPRLQLPAQAAGGWAVSPGGVGEWRPIFENPSAVAEQRFEQGGRAVGLYVAYYRAQNFERKLVSSENMLVATVQKRWNLVSARQREVKLADGSTLRVRSADVRANASQTAGPATRYTAWQFYWVDDRLTSGDFDAKLRIALGRLMGRGDDGAMVTLYTQGPVDDDLEPLLGSLLSTQLEPLLQALRQTRSQQ